MRVFFLYFFIVGGYMKILSKILLSTLFFSAVMNGDGDGMAPVPVGGATRQVKRDFINNDWDHFDYQRKYAILLILFENQNLTENICNQLYNDVVDNVLGGAFRLNGFINMALQEKKDHLLGALIPLLNDDHGFVFENNELIALRNILNVVGHVSAPCFEQAMVLLRAPVHVPVPGGGVEGHFGVVQRVIQNIANHFPNIGVELFENRKKEMIMFFLFLTIVYCAYQGHSVTVPTFLLAFLFSGIKSCSDVCSTKFLTLIAGTCTIIAFLALIWPKKLQDEFE
jgi:hypothetical protein